MVQKHKAPGNHNNKIARITEPKKSAAESKCGAEIMNQKTLAQSRTA